MATPHRKKRTNKMKRLWIGNTYVKYGRKFDRIDEEIDKAGFIDTPDDVELFGDPDGDFQLVNHGSRDCFMIKEKGKYITDQDEIYEWEEMWCS